jgi:hypothetical protein
MWNDSEPHQFNSGFKWKERNQKMLTEHASLSPDTVQYFLKKEQENTFR